MNEPNSPATQRHRLADRISGRAWRELNAIVPRTRWGDTLLSWLRFVSVHMRLPNKRSPLFNDRLYALKTSDEMLEPLRAFTTDKEYVKLYVKARVGERFNIPTLAVLHSADECRRFAFPERCVIKPTHLSGAVILRRQGEPIDFARIDSWLRINYYHGAREVQYRHLQPKIIVEPFVFDDDNPSDYKIFCVSGEPRLIQVDADRHTRHTRGLFDIDWQQQPCSFIYPVIDTPTPRPANLALMLDLAGRLSRDFSFVRVDFYSDGEHALVGELTHCPENLRGWFAPPGSEAAVSSMLFGGGAAPRQRSAIATQTP